MTPEERFERFEISLHNIRDVLAETAAMNLRTEATLRRAIRLLVRDDFHERRRAADERQDELFDKLAAAQFVTEEMLRRFIQSRA